jgi:hypothetical protein
MHTEGKLQEDRIDGLSGLGWNIKDGGYVKCRRLLQHQSHMILSIWLDIRSILLHPGYSLHMLRQSATVGRESEAHRPYH